MGLRCPHLLGDCFTPVFCGAVVLVRSSRPMYGEAWLSQKRFILITKLSSIWLQLNHAMITNSISGLIPK